MQRKILAVVIALGLVGCANAPDEPKDEKVATTAQKLCSSDPWEGVYSYDAEGDWGINAFSSDAPADAYALPVNCSTATDDFGGGGSFEAPAEAQCTAWTATGAYKLVCEANNNGMYYREEKRMCAVRSKLVTETRWVFARNDWCPDI